MNVLATGYRATVLVERSRRLRSEPGHPTRSWGMHCHTSTLRTYRERIAKRFGIKGKAALVVWAMTNKLV